MIEKLRVTVVATVLAGGMASASEHLITEIYTVGFRPVGEIVALIRPLVPAPGAVTAYRDKLVVKASESTHADIERILAEVDRAPANLMVSVRHTIDADVRRDLGQVFARIESDHADASLGREPDARQGGLGVTVGDEHRAVGGRVVRTQRASEDRDVHRVRLLEGQEAFVQTGVSVPTAAQALVITGIGVSEWRGVQYRDVTRGFFVRPRLTPDGVVVEIRTHRDSPRLGGGDAFEVRSSATTVSGPLGRWMRIAAVGEVSGRSATGIAHSTEARADTDYAVYLKVDRLAQ